VTTFSAVLAVRDEEPMIEGALQLLGFCDEIVVVIDDRTIDQTEQIARRYTDNVHRVSRR
jgi:glycosyltransferase involved in cell wall biosynthesis